MQELTKELLEEVIVSELNKLKYDEPDENGNGKSNANDVINLCKVMIEQDKVELEFDERINKREAEAKALKETQELENQFRESQAKEQKWDRRIKYALDAASIGLPLIFYGVWMNRGFKFEETGTFTSATFRGLFGRFSPKK